MNQKEREASFVLEEKLCSIQYSLEIANTLCENIEHLFENANASETAKEFERRYDGLRSQAYAAQDYVFSALNSVNKLLNDQSPPTCLPETKPKEEKTPSFFELSRIEPELFDIGVAMEGLTSLMYILLEGIEREARLSLGSPAYCEHLVGRIKDMYYPGLARLCSEFRSQQQAIERIEEAPFGEAAAKQTPTSTCE